MYGVDLAEWWQARRWRALLDLIDNLPSSSLSRLAALEDPEVIAQIAEEPSPDTWRPDQRDWNLTNELMAAIHDRLGDVTQAVLSTIEVPRGKSRPKYPGKPFPRPESAVQQARDDLARRIGWSLIEQFFPEGGD